MYIFVYFSTVKEKKNAAWIYCKLSGLISKKTFEYKNGWFYREMNNK